MACKRSAYERLETIYCTFEKNTFFFTFRDAQSKSNANLLKNTWIVFKPYMHFTYIDRY